MIKVTIFIGLLLGIIQGLTEFLPVSSTAHLAIAQYVLTGGKTAGAGLSDEEKTKLEEQWLAFDVMLHLGTLLAVVIYLHREVWSMVRGFWFLCLSVSKRLRPQPGSAACEDRRLLLLVIYATIPTCVIAMLIKKTVMKSLDDIVAIGFFLMITGVILFVTRSFREEGRNLTGMRWLDALIVGVVQGIAALPGISRSGSTISTGIFLKLDRKLAARFSFLISIPAICGAAIIEGKDMHASVLSQMWLPILAGVVAACVFGYIAIGIAFRVLEKRKFAWFAPYCWVVGAACVVVGLLKLY